MPFLDQMLVSFFITATVIILISLLDKNEADSNALVLEPGIFRTKRSFNILSFIIMAILTFIYAIFF